MSPGGDFHVEQRAEMLKIFMEIGKMPHLILLLLPLWAGQIGNAQSAADAGNAGAQPENFHLVSTGIYRGARIENQAQADYLVQTMGIKTVIDLQGGDRTNAELNKITDDLWKGEFPRLEKGETPAEIAQEKTRFEKSGLNGKGFLNPQLDSIGIVTPQEAVEISDIIKTIANPQTPHPIYVHCAHGADRTGLIIALYRVFEENMSPKEAHDEMVKMGHNFEHRIFTGDMDKYFWHAVKAISDSKRLRSVDDNEIKGDAEIEMDHAVDKLSSFLKSCFGR